jgi:hypothetical protein
MTARAAAIKMLDRWLNRPRWLWYQGYRLRRRLASGIEAQRGETA